MKQIKGQYEEYWYNENLFQESSSHAPEKPAPYISGKLSASGKEYNLKIPEDYSIMRQHLGERKQDRVFCLRKDKIAEVFPDLYQLALVKLSNIKIYTSEEAHSPSNFFRKLIPGIGSTIVPHLAAAIKKQFDTIVISGKNPNHPKSQIWVDEQAFPASVFCYAKHAQSTLFSIKPEAKEFFDKLPEFQTRNPEMTRDWLNMPRISEYFNKRFAELDSEVKLSANNPKAYSSLEEIIERKEAWTKSARDHFFQPNQNPKPTETLDINYRKITATEVAVTKVKIGSKASAFIKNTTMLETFDIIDFLAPKFKNKVTAENHDRYFPKAPSKRKEHWLGFIQRIRDSIPDEQKALVGNLAITICAKLKIEEGLGSTYSPKKGCSSLYLDTREKTEIIQKVKESAKELFGQDLELSNKQAKLEKSFERGSA